MKYLITGDHKQIHETGKCRYIKNHELFYLFSWRKLYDPVEKHVLYSVYSQGNNDKRPN